MWGRSGGGSDHVFCQLRVTYRLKESLDTAGFSGRIAWEELGVSSDHVLCQLTLTYAWETHRLNSVMLKTGVPDRSDVINVRPLQYPSGTHVRVNKTLWLY
ncbi:hypothetical protein GDO78_010052 [Eleutherodactylus coqui]|uniref:Uncharacterized protein n=1 Tax=Eleutherodactylus coqui TaxID=57060 RepID=A0A8J6K8B7_ELECQ|nr:hypothetical protein GDO78_010052 [Eleutherodactylus coqui]